MSRLRVLLTALALGALLLPLAGAECRLSPFFPGAYARLLNCLP